MHRTFRKWGVSILALGMAQSAPADDGLTFFGGAGQAIRQPTGMVVLTPCPSAGPLGDNAFIGALDFTDDGETFYSAAIDRLASGDVATGLAADFGRFDAGMGRVQCFVLDVFETTLTDGPGSLSGVTNLGFAVMATVGWSVTDNEDPFETQPLYLTGRVAVPIPSDTVLLDQTFQYPAEGEPIDSLKVTITVDTTGEFEIELSSFVGPDTPAVLGDLIWGTDGGDGEPLIQHTVTGLSIGPDGQVYVLTEADTEPTGKPVLYTVEPLPSDMLPMLEMTTVAVLVTDDPESLWSIEFVPDGTLFAAGEDLYTVDLESGALTLIGSPGVGIIGSPGVGIIVELTATPDGTLYGLSHDDEFTTRLYELDTTTGAATLVMTLPGETIWGLAVLPYDEGDLDRDGDVDDDDLAIYADQYTGPLSEPFVPPGPGGTWITDPIVVPMVDFMGFPTVFDPNTTRIPLDAVDAEFPGIVTSGPFVDPEDSSATIHLAHDSTNLYVGFDVIDDILEGNNDEWELYLDSNNSDLKETEGDAYGFQAFVEADGTEGGDSGAFPVWGSGFVKTLLGAGAQISVEMKATDMVAGGTYGFDVAITETDGSDVTHYFLFSTTEDGTHNEQQWGNIKLAEGPLPLPPTDPVPANFLTNVDEQPLLNWTPPAEATAYNVFLGADAGNLIYQGQTTEPTFAAPALSAGWNYFWRVDAVSENGIRTGTVWQFHTAYRVADLDHDGDVDEDDETAILEDADLDADGIADCLDNCPDVANSDQADGDADGLGDACDPSTCDGDVNNDGVIDPLDAGYIQSRFGCSVGTGDVDCDAADANGDGVVDPLDVGYVLSRFGDCD